MSKPRVLIPVPTSFDTLYNAKSWPEYAQAVSMAGGEPVQVDLACSTRELQAMVEDAAGVLLPGSGADVDPVRYGHPRDPASAPPDPFREDADRAILEAVERMKKPLLGICLGVQSLNVFRGGTLIQDVAPMPVNHRAGRSVAAAHAAEFAQGSRLGAAIGDNQSAGNLDSRSVRILVNSSHHQAVGLPGTSLRIVARCPEDGVVEAIEGTDPEHWLLGVQWHPERTIGSSPISSALFAAFLRAAAMTCLP